jgi:exopolysaccharide biosynthesis predicted pyruvyltransferase EpsI
MAMVRTKVKVSRSLLFPALTGLAGLLVGLQVGRLSMTGMCIDLLPLVSHAGDRLDMPCVQKLTAQDPTEDKVIDTRDGGKTVQHAELAVIQARAHPKNKKKRIYPWDSQPPEPISLFDSSSPAVLQRHKCIQAIRERHVDILGPMMTTTTQDPPLLVNPAYHGNVGDTMLTMGEIGFLQKTMNLGVPLQCHYNQAKGFYRSCAEIMIERDNQERNNKLALWHAGGNWGDLYEMQVKRIDSFKPLLQHNYTIIGMPQSLHYSDKHTQDADVQKIKENIVVGLGIVKAHPKPINTTTLDDPKIRELAHSRVIFTWREQESYDLAVKIYPFVKNVVVPDIAFQLGPYEAIRNNSKKNVDILVILRDDKESMYKSMRNNEYVQSVLSSKTGKQFSSLVVDWKNRLKIFDSKDVFFTTTSIELLSLGKVVVLDRLHAAILCYLAGLPFVYIDQSTGKITKTLGVAFGGDGMEDCQDGEKSMWAKANTLDEALVKAVDLIDHHSSTS